MPPASVWAGVALGAVSVVLEMVARRQQDKAAAVSALSLRHIADVRSEVEASGPKLVAVRGAVTPAADGAYIPLLWTAPSGRALAEMHRVERENAVAGFEHERGNYGARAAVVDATRYLKFYETTKRGGAIVEREEWDSHHRWEVPYVIQDNSGAVRSDAPPPLTALADIEDLLDADMRHRLNERERKRRNARRRHQRRRTNNPNDPGNVDGFREGAPRVAFAMRTARRVLEIGSMVTLVGTARVEDGVLTIGAGAGPLIASHLSLGKLTGSLTSNHRLARGFAVVSGGAALALIATGVYKLWRAGNPAA